MEALSYTNAHGEKVRRAIQRRTIDFAADIIPFMPTTGGMCIGTNKRLRVCEAQGTASSCWGDAYTSSCDAPRRLPRRPRSSACLGLPVSNLAAPQEAVCNRFVHVSANKERATVNCAAFTPDGRRCLTANLKGQFTLWNGAGFNFETILQAHETPVRAMEWSHNELWLLSVDDTGNVKYWQPNMNNVKLIPKAHKESIRGVSFSPTDLKFCTGADDTTVKVWDFARCHEECAMAGHGGDVKGLEWHPSSSIIASASKDALIKLWDARAGGKTRGLGSSSGTNTGGCVATMHGHKGSVLTCTWNRNGNWLLSGARDQVIKVWDIRMLREINNMRGHGKEVTSLAWHPMHERLFASGTYNGEMFFWLVDASSAAAATLSAGNNTMETLGCEPLERVPNAHDGAIWTIAWHPLGHVMCTGSNDNTAKFWCRQRIGEALNMNTGTRMETMDAILGSMNHVAAAGVDADRKRNLGATGMPGFGNGMSGGMGGGNDTRNAMSGSSRILAHSNAFKGSSMHTGNHRASGDMTQQNMHGTNRQEEKAGPQPLPTPENARSVALAIIERKKKLQGGAGIGFDVAEVSEIVRLRLAENGISPATAQ